EDLTVINANLAIEVDKELKQVIYKVIDLETGETIKQIPSEDLIRIAKKMKEIVEQYSENHSGGLQIFMDSGAFG
ncbi:MAG: flagellar protein FlaG, partial [Thermodesulfobacteriota bacterium]